MINLILTAIGFFIIGIIFVWLKRKIFNKFINTSKKILTNSSIGNIYKKDGTESFQAKKALTGLFAIRSGVQWSKSIKEIIDIRKIIIYMTIIGLIFAYGFFQGRINAPVKVDLGHGKEAFIRLNGNYLHIGKDGYLWIEDKEGNKLKQIQVKDIPALKKKLSPIGLQFVPIAVLGAGFGERGDGAVEAGAGVSFARFWKWRLDAFITSYPAVYLGTSYKLDGIGLKNSAIGVGIGRGFKNWQLDQSDTRAIIYFRIRF